jgi:O-antigen ligase
MASDHTRDSSRLYTISTYVWVVILVLIGTYFRVRRGEAKLVADWLIFTQVSVCFLGAFLGILLMRKNRRLGFGAKILLIFIFTTILSAINSPFSTRVIGYWILLTGTGLLTIGLVQGARTVKDLERIEKLWFYTITCILIKDTITALVIYGTGESYRLGMMITHPNLLSLNAAIAFWVSFRKRVFKSILLLWLVRLFLLFIIFTAKSRTSLICWAAGGIVLFYFHKGHQSEKSVMLKAAIPCVLIALISAGLLAFSFELPGTAAAFNYFRRGQDISTLWTLTGRTEIWSYAFEKIFSNPSSLLFGNGYGVTKFIINEEYLESLQMGVYSLRASHLHNVFLETLFSAGLLGVIPLIIMIAYSFNWFLKFKELQSVYSVEFSVRALVVVIMVFINSMIESFLGTKINPIMMIFLFYLLALGNRYNLATPDKPFS